MAINHGCFVCGVLDGEFEHDNGPYDKCLVCGNRSIVPVEVAMEMLQGFMEGREEFDRSEILIEDLEDIFENGELYIDY